MIVINVLTDSMLSVANLEVAISEVSKLVDSDGVIRDIISDDD